MKTLLIDPTEKSTISVTNPHKICRDKVKRKLYNREEEKNNKWCTQKDDKTITIQNPMDIEKKDNNKPLRSKWSVTDSIFVTIKYIFVIVESFSVIVNSFFVIVKVIRLQRSGIDTIKYHT